MMLVKFEDTTKLKNKSIDIPLTSGVTWIDGYSNVGKTYLFDCMSRMSESEGRSVITINEKNSNLILHINELKNSIIVIDRFDVIRLEYPQSIGLINSHFEPIIIFGRTATDVRLYLPYIFELKLKDNELYLTRVLGNERVPY